MKKTQFKQSYRFLNHFFQMTIGRPDFLLYEPFFQPFFKEFFQPFNIQIRINEMKNLELKVDGGTRIVKEEFESEEEMIAFLKKEMVIRKKIGALHRTFNI